MSNVAEKLTLHNVFDDCRRTVRATSCSLSRFPCCTYSGRERWGCEACDRKGRLLYLVSSRDVRPPKGGTSRGKAGTDEPI